MQFNTNYGLFKNYMSRNMRKTNNVDSDQV